jgi:hypothetical protein
MGVKLLYFLLSWIGRHLDYSLHHCSKTAKPAIQFNHHFTFYTSESAMYFPIRCCRRKRLPLSCFLRSACHSIRSASVMPRRKDLALVVVTKLVRLPTGIQTPILAFSLQGGRDNDF